MIDTTAILYQSIERDLLYKTPISTYLCLLIRGANSRSIIGNHDVFDDSDMFSHPSRPDLRLHSKGLKLDFKYVGERENVYRCMLKYLR
jgi:hypothetical protein